MAVVEWIDRFSGNGKWYRRKKWKEWRSSRTDKVSQFAIIRFPGEGGGDLPVGGWKETFLILNSAILAGGGGGEWWLNNLRNIRICGTDKRSSRLLYVRQSGDTRILLLVCCYIYGPTWNGIISAQQSVSQLHSTQLHRANEAVAQWMTKLICSSRGTRNKFQLYQKNNYAK